MGCCDYNARMPEDPPIPDWLTGCLGLGCAALVSLVLAYAVGWGLLWLGFRGVG